MDMTPTRPYLLRAIYEWIVDNGCTPHILVDATMAGVRVPPHTVRDGQVVLNIAMQAVDRLELGNQEVSFHARFSGQPFAVCVPVAAVLAVYARENGQGMMFPADAAEDPATEGAITGPALAPVAETTPPPDAEPPRPERARPALRIVK